jgi:hypothetical protein
VPQAEVLRICSTVGAKGKKKVKEESKLSVWGRKCLIRHLIKIVLPSRTEIYMKLKRKNIILSRIKNILSLPSPSTK